MGVSSLSRHPWIQLDQTYSGSCSLHLLRTEGPYESHMRGRGDILSIPSRSRDTRMKIIHNVCAVHAFYALGHAWVELILKGPLYGSCVNLVRA